MSATATFLVLYSTPADPETFERHYSDVHVPLTKAPPAFAATPSPGSHAPSGATRATSLPPSNGTP